jgi:hypothetical protein
MGQRKELAAPNVQAIMTPGVEQRIAPWISEGERLESGIAGTKAQAKTLEKSAGEATAQSTKLREKLNEAQTLMDMGDRKSAKAAYASLNDALRLAGLDREEFKAARELISRVNTEEQKTALLRKIFGYGVGGAVLEEGGRRMVK